MRQLFSWLLVATTLLAVHSAVLAQGEVGGPFPWESKPDQRWVESSLPAFPTPRPASGRIVYRKVPMAEPYVALTHDDGPHPANTPRLLDTLKQRGVRATFFLKGDLVKMYPKIARRIADEGHEIANHTWSHPWFIKIPDRAVLRELQLCHDAIVEVTGTTPKIMRPPGELIRPYQTQMIFDQFGYRDIRWSVDPRDAVEFPPPPATIAHRILAQVHNGAIILSHDIKRQTVDAMPMVLDGLLARGFRFVTVSELLAMDRPQPAAPFTAEELAELGAPSSP